jgi:putative DNA primase/helicase
VPANLNLVNTGKSLNVHDKDSLMNVLSGWLAELGELDATFKKSDIAALKAFLTQTVDEIRRPYAAASSRYARRTVFAASVNDETFLGDPTGNSRFWVIPVSAVVHDHSIDMQQLWAEVLALWKAGEVHYLSQSEMGEVSVHNNQFEQSDPIVELITDGLAWADFSETRCKWMSASEILRWLDVRSPSKRDTSLAGAAVLKLNGGLKKRLSTGRYLAVPLSKAMGVVDVGGEVW